MPTKNAVSLKSLSSTGKPSDLTDVAALASLSKRGRSLVGQEMFKILDKARKLEESGLYIYHLELGNSRLRPPMEIIRATVESIESLNVGYASSAGLPKLRSALAERYSRLSGRVITEENVIISPANLLISQFLDLTCNPGDRVVLFTPAFPSYFAAAAYIGLDVIDVPLDSVNNYDLLEEHVERAIAARPRAVIVNSANNPTGAIYDRKVLDLLARRCAEAGIWLLSDETYAELCYGRPFYSLSGAGHAQLIVISSFSKILSIPGFRVGYAIADKFVADRLALSNSTLISCLPTFVQEGCAAGLQVIDRHVANIRDYFSKVTRECSDMINRSDVLTSYPPQAGFYMFLDVSASGLDDVSFSRRLLEQNRTAVTPGRSFGEKFKTSIRIATCGNHEDVVLGINEVVSLVRELRA